MSSTNATLATTVAATAMMIEHTIQRTKANGTPGTLISMPSGTTYDFCPKGEDQRHTAIVENQNDLTRFLQIETFRIAQPTDVPTARGLTGDGSSEAGEAGAKPAPATDPTPPVPSAEEVEAAKKLLADNATQDVDPDAAPTDAEDGGTPQDDTAPTTPATPPTAETPSETDTPPETPPTDTPLADLSPEQLRVVYQMELGKAANGRAKDETLIAQIETNREEQAKKTPAAE
jgi:hypothetical protein